MILFIWQFFFVFYLIFQALAQLYHSSMSEEGWIFVYRGFDYTVSVKENKILIVMFHPEPPAQEMPALEEEIEEIFEVVPPNTPVESAASSS